VDRACWDARQCVLVWSWTMIHSSDDRLCFSRARPAESSCLRIRTRFASRLLPARRTRARALWTCLRARHVGEFFSSRLNGGQRRWSSACRIGSSRATQRRCSARLLLRQLDAIIVSANALRLPRLIGQI
jgi:hypothetical protein